MSFRFRPGIIIIFILLIAAPSGATAQLVAHAGADAVVCPGGSVVIGGAPAATGGLAPYTYTWSPSAGLSSSTSPNPTAAPTADISYTLSVRDDTGAVATDVVMLTMSYLTYTNAGTDTSICENSTAVIGGSNNVTWAGITYSWSPGTTLNDSTLAHPTAMPGLTTTTYTLTAGIAGCPPKSDAVTVTVIPTPPISAGNDTTIMEGAVAVLNASGGAAYAWGPTSTLTYPFTAHPDAEPIVTTTYYLYGTGPDLKCPNYDSVIVYVEPSDDVVIYNTFSPNGDGNNDTWYIGNIYKYPDNKLEIYNRNGKLVYKTSSYLNTWDGKAFGEDLPAATYFFVLDLGEGNPKHHGTVTIIK